METIAEFINFISVWFGGLPVIEAGLIALVVRGIKAVKGKLPDWLLYPAGLIVANVLVLVLRQAAGLHGWFQQRIRV